MRITEAHTVLLSLMAASSGRSVYHKIEFLTRYFLGCPYLIGALGEGADGVYNQRPCYRTDAFDCLTLVNTILALANAENLTQFIDQMARVNYSNGVVSYLRRHHFMSVDWNIHNAWRGIIRDITMDFPDYEMACAKINRPGWFQKRSIQDIHLADSDPGVIDHKLEALHLLAEQVKSEYACLPYMPLSVLFDPCEQANEKLFSQLPDVFIVEIVRPAWDLVKLIGTKLHVSHLGFVLRREDELIFRHASITEACVVEVPLVDYLKKYLFSPTVKGINIQKIIA